jgi:hypothetical protein
MAAPAAVAKGAKKSKNDSDSLKFNKKNKPILVSRWKGFENFEKEFESITDTIKYFDSILSIKLDIKNLYLHLKGGKSYKGYYFSFLK